MKKKEFVVIVILSVILNIFLSLGAFALGNLSFASGFPFKWSSFDFLGSNTDYGMLLMDVVFWFLVIFVFWKVLQKVLKK